MSEYTAGVSQFVSANADRYRNKENRLFVSRPENEYHLNMICAEILNRAFKAEFDRTNSKIVLLPSCMQKNPDKCRAVFVNGEKKCVQCTEECYINQLTKILSDYGVETRIIPHSSQFSVFLEKWKDNKETGLVGIACVLNLIKGGYEMRRLGIPSQCVFLDYCGCRNHWHTTGVPTKININRLMHILQIKEKIHE